MAVVVVTSVSAQTSSTSLAPAKTAANVPCRSQVVVLGIQSLVQIFNAGQQAVISVLLCSGLVLVLDGHLNAAYFFLADNL